jgi:hypothetical protein
MIATRMSPTRRAAILAFLASASGLPGQDPSEQKNRRTLPDSEKDEDPRLPNGKSQKDAISKQAHEDALREVESLIQLAEDLRDELKRNGEFVVAVSSLKKTEEIEKLARHIRGKLKA